jgi:hypothetical protein
MNLTKVYSCNKKQEVSIIEIEVTDDKISVGTDVLCDPIDDNIVEDRAREYLDEGDSWQLAVQSGNTEMSKEDWIEEVLTYDGAVETLQLERETSYLDTTYWWNWSCIGCIESYIPKEIKKLNTLGSPFRKPTLYELMVAKFICKYKLGKSENVDERLEEILKEFMEDENEY